MSAAVPNLITHWVYGSKRHDEIAACPVGHPAPRCQFCAQAARLVLADIRESIRGP
jgi:hypothetical protein